MKTSSFISKYSLMVGLYLIVFFMALVTLFSLASPEAVNQEIQRSPVLNSSLFNLSLIALTIIVASWIIVWSYLKNSSKTLNKH